MSSESGYSGNQVDYLDYLDYRNYLTGGGHVICRT